MLAAATSTDGFFAAARLTASSKLMRVGTPATGDAAWTLSPGTCVCWTSDCGCGDGCGDGCGGCASARTGRARRPRMAKGRSTRLFMRVLRRDDFLDFSTLARRQAPNHHVEHGNED